MVCAQYLRTHVRMCNAKITYELYCSLCTLHTMYLQYVRICMYVCTYVHTHVQVATSQEQVNWQEERPYTLGTLKGANIYE